MWRKWWGMGESGLWVKASILRIMTEESDEWVCTRNNFYFLCIITRTFRDRSILCKMHAFFLSLTMTVSPWYRIFEYTLFRRIFVWLIFLLSLSRQLLFFSFCCPSFSPLRIFLRILFADRTKLISRWIFISSRDLLFIVFICSFPFFVLLSILFLSFCIFLVTDISYSFLFLFLLPIL